MQIVVNSLLIRYTRLSQLQNLPKLLILHGWGDSSKGWADIQTTLSRNYEVYVVDLPGFGGSDMPPVAWGLDAYAEFVAAFLAKIRVKPDVIIGHSNGGAIAIRGLASGRLATGKLVLLSSAGVRSEYKGRKHALRIVAKTGKALAMPLPSKLKDRLRRKLYTTIGSDMLIAEHLQETFKKVVNDDVQADAMQLTVPTLLIYGQDDIATPPAWGMLLHERIEGSTLEIIGEAGHFVHQDQPAKTLQLMEQFIHSDDYSSDRPAA